MSRVVALFLSTFLFLSNVGLALNMHYCSGNLKSVSVVLEAASCCCDGVAEFEDECCSDETIYVQLDQESKIVASCEVSLDHHYFVESRAAVEDLGSVPQLEPQEYADFQNLPPPQKEPFYITNCSLLVYG